jgi:hypothetical protein
VPPRELDGAEQQQQPHAHALPTAPLMRAQLTPPLMRAQQMLPL